MLTLLNPLTSSPRCWDAREFPAPRTCKDGTCCLPADGTCDGVITQCLPGSSSECVDVFGAPVIPGTPLLNFCACEGPIPLDDAWACAPDWTCPENEACFPDQVCLEFDLLCMFLDGCPDPAYGGGICVGPEILEMTLFE